ncbi:hypothetical protein B0T22DRAFT_245329 [Podospora appendiculata]|uniref:Uncharacterized protein n=1 Tax=Podospora appendiculata TaxID=314037 RepID=A0AAE0X1Y6_9PEZI|nr:hypothetical protein B0T22DRAFT_245329 [Podospora appendiculata]
MEPADRDLPPLPPVSPLSPSPSPSSFSTLPRRNITPASQRDSDGSPQPYVSPRQPHRRPPSPPLASPPSFPRHNFEAAPSSSSQTESVPTGQTRLLIALDYGTTFTGIAYLSVSKQKEQDLNALVDDIRVLSRWPTSDSTTESPKVPSEISYSPSPKGCLQWGHDIDDGSRVLKWTKLELEENRDRGAELKTLAETLYGLRLLDLSESAVIDNNIPRHLAKEPEDIVRDYLEFIAEQTLEEIHDEVGKKVPENIPIDMIVTHPAKWSDRALNSTFRAVRAAFNADLFPKIRDISFVSEPEACAHFTLREEFRQNEGENPDANKSEKHAKFRKNDCFIVVDAGGGTVDLASYKVVSLDFEKKQVNLQQIGYPIGDKCGATYIDRGFNEVVRRRLGEEDWKKLTEEDAQDPGTGGHEMMKAKARLLHTRFEPIKHGFDGKDQKLGFPLQLPRGIGETDNPDEGVLGGAMKITVEDLKYMFKFPVERTLYLLGQATTQVEIGEKLKVKKIFLSGGFARNQYLYDRIIQFGKTRRIEVVRGEEDKCWTAVARGAIIKSLGMYTDKPAIVKSCPRHYGIKVRTQFAAYKHKPADAEVDVEGIPWATDQIRWFVQKGDAIFPGKPVVATYDCHWSMKASDYPSPPNPLAPNSPPSGRRGNNGASAAAGLRPMSVPPPQPGQQGQPLGEVFREVVFVASAQDEAPIRFAARSKTQDQVITLRCDLTKVPEGNMAEFANEKVGRYLKFWVKVEIHVFDKVEVKITSGGKVLASAEAPL